jgi:pheromone shutdown protein TraB
MPYNIIQYIFANFAMASKKPLKALIVEDNAFMATVLHDMLKQYASAISVLAIANTG